MNTERDVERRVAAWLEDGPTDAASWVVDEAIAVAGRLPQRRFVTSNGRSVAMFSAFRLAAVAVVAVVVAVGAWRLLPASSGGPGASSAQLPAGTFSRSVPANGAGAPAGTWTLSFADGQLWLQGPSGQRIADQVGATPAGQLQLLPDLNPDICSFGSGATGQYAWALAGGSLTLTSVADPSPCRASILAGEWAPLSTP